MSPIQDESKGIVPTSAVARTASLFLFAPALLRVAPMVAEAFEKGGGVAFDEIGSDGIEALDWLNCGQYKNQTNVFFAARP
jgi:hypothetical protein